MSLPVRLESRSFERIWGSPETEPWCANPERRPIGEVWFEASEAVPLLVKFLFTSDNLSIQVHPRDEYARRHGHARGKTEMWHILRAEADAKIALGPLRAISPPELRAAALDGHIESLLRWEPVRAGNTFFVPAGTIHALGGGLALCEIQQLSDVTYRLYDFGRLQDGRLRELHLADGMAVSSLEPYEGLATHRALGAGRELLVECSYFRTEKLTVSGTAQCPSPGVSSLYIAVLGEGTIGGKPFRQGETWEAARGCDAFEITSERAEWLIAAPPA